jgi:hypothetical protein
MSDPRVLDAKEMGGAKFDFLPAVAFSGATEEIQN